MDDFGGEISKGKPCSSSLIEIDGGLEKPTCHFVFGEGLATVRCEPKLRGPNEEDAKLLRHLRQLDSCGGSVTLVLNLLAKLVE